MADMMTTRIQSHPDYQTLKHKRNRLGWLLTLSMLVVYYGFIALIAFNKSFLALPLGTGVMTLGIPIGFGVILFTIAVTGFYVWQANKKFDALNAKVLAENHV